MLNTDRRRCHCHPKRVQRHTCAERQPSVADDFVDGFLRKVDARLGHGFYNAHRLQMLHCRSNLFFCLKNDSSTSPFFIHQRHHQLHAASGQVRYGQCQRSDADDGRARAAGAVRTDDATLSFSCFHSAIPHTLHFRFRSLIVTTSFCCVLLRLSLSP